MTHTHAVQTFDTITRSPDEAAAALTSSACAPCGETAQTLSALAAADATLADMPATDTVAWSGVIAIEGQVTGDGRMIEANALRWDTLPMPFRYAPTDEGGHYGAVTVGRILTLERRDGGIIWGTGDLDLSMEGAMECARAIGSGAAPGVSMDLDSVSFEIRVARELLEREEELEADDEANEVPDGETDAEGRVTVITINADDELMVTTDARIRAATSVGIPAFEGARITLDSPLGEDVGPVEENGSGGDAQEVAASAVAAPPAASPFIMTIGGNGTPSSLTVTRGRGGGRRLTAAAYRTPLDPPAEWFTNPNLTEPTPLVVTREGRVYGHVAVWGTCHTGYPGQCVTPPRSPSGYALFRTGSVLCSDGTTVPTGRLTIDTLHAGTEMSAAQAAAHYESTGRAAADVAAGDDAIGIWVAGYVRPGTTEEQVRALRASPLSGDWRTHGGALEMIGVLGVNVPGFPIPRPHGLAAGGQMRTLVAAGMLPPRLNVAPATLTLSDDDVRYLRTLAARERARHDDRADAMAREVQAMALMRDVSAVRSR